jgi:hypothetical protein
MFQNKTFQTSFFAKNHNYNKKFAVSIKSFKVSTIVKNKEMTALKTIGIEF